MIIIAERINATRKRIRKAIQARDEAHIRREIVTQDQAGGDYIDLNAGTGGGPEQEAEDLKWLVDLALDSTEKKLALDSADGEALKAAATHVGGRRAWMLNSIKGDAKSLDAMLPLAAEHAVPFVALAMDENGISKDAQGRVKVCRRIHEAAVEASIQENNIFFDPLVMPVSADQSAGAVTLEALRLIKDSFPECRTVMGLSNVSHGLPLRSDINLAFLTAALSVGLDSAICDPTDPGIRKTVLLGELVAGRDRYCRRFTRAVRKGELD